MRAGQLMFGLVAVIGLVIAFEVGRHSQVPVVPGGNPNTRLIRISASPDAGKCTVDFPVAFLRYSQDSVQWASNDSKYWISFLTIDAPAGYTPESPLAPTDDPVVVEPNSTSRTYTVKPKTKYYMYAIFGHDPAINSKNPCKSATDDRDTGLNIKP